MQTNTAHRTQVIIVGAGPVGFITAYGLARKGIEVRLLEADASISSSPRAAIYFPTTLEILDRLGLLEEAQTIGYSSTRFAMRYPATGEVIEADATTSVPPGSRYAQNLHMGQHVLADLVMRHLLPLPNARLLWRHKVASLEQDGTGVSLGVDTPEGHVRMCSDWVVGTDGSHSTVRQRLGLPFEGHTWPDRFVATNLEFDFAAHGFQPANMISDPDEWGVVARLGRDNLWRVTFGEDASLDEGGVHERIPQHYARLLPAPGPYRIVAAAPYRVHERCAPRFRVGRVLLAGDAAHVCNPCGGMGLTSGVIDADALVQVLDAVIHGRAGDEALDFYAEERRRVFREVVSPIATSFKRQLSEKDPGQRARDRLNFKQGAENPDASSTASYLSTRVLGRAMPV
ncbi:MAG TPA: FAD-dependent monooxygenase [Burkholderiales bacterium]|nr:FAD-dependent monooxygenase [Burkholderiales bacterium]